jgi:glycine cleavage system aminomethyltransferase T
VTAGGETLAAAIDRCGGAVPLLRNASGRPVVFPVAPEFSNWRSEQRAWREGCALLDQSHHLTDLFVQGPDSLRALARLAVNSFESFEVDRAKQFAAVNHDGFMIGDGILFHLAPDSFDLVGHRMVVDWVQFNLESGEYDVVLERDDDSLVREGPPRLYRYELQGPTAGAIVERLIEGPLPEVRFFTMCTFAIDGLDVRALRHGMAGRAGFELFGPWEEGGPLREAILGAGAGLGLAPAGARAYSTANLESGWIPSPVPAIFTGDELNPYREWLPAARAGSLGGSFESTEISDYYVTPYDLGYGRLVAYDHDFIGREALEKLDPETQRRKVTLVWDADDVAGAIGTWFRKGEKAKYFELPKSRYALYQADAVLAGGEHVGISHDCGYIANEEAFVSLASVEPGLAGPGTEVTVLWGESPPSAKPQVEPHTQVEIRATVAPVPFAEYARETYRSAVTSRP